MVVQPPPSSLDPTSTAFRDAATLVYIIEAARVVSAIFSIKLTNQTTTEIQAIQPYWSQLNAEHRSQWLCGFASGIKARQLTNTDLLQSIHRIAEQTTDDVIDDILEEEING